MPSDSICGSASAARKQGCGARVERDGPSRGLPRRIKVRFAEKRVEEAICFDRAMDALAQGSAERTSPLPPRVARYVRREVAV